MSVHLMHLFKFSISVLKNVATTRHRRQNNRPTARCGDGLSCLASCGAVYCNRYCLWVVFVYGSVNSKSRASILTKLGFSVKAVTISSWLNFGRAPPGRGSALGRNYLAPPYYNQRAVFASPLSAFCCFVCSRVFDVRQQRSAEFSARIQQLQPTLINETGKSLISHHRRTSRGAVAPPPNIWAVRFFGQWRKFGRKARKGFFGKKYFLQIKNIF